MSAFATSLSRTLARRALVKVRPRVAAASNTLSDAMRVIDIEGGAAVYIPHYWARFVHDGRLLGQVPAIKGSGLWIWWRNPAEDPRFPGSQTPERVRELRSLTRTEFKAAMRQAAARPGSVIFTKVIRKSTPPNRFFSNSDGMLGFREEAGEIAKKEFSRHVREELGDLFNIEDEVVIRL